MVLRETAAQCSSPSAACLCSKTIRLLLHEVNSTRRNIWTYQMCKRMWTPRQALVLVLHPPASAPRSRLRIHTNDERSDHKLRKKLEC